MKKFLLILSIISCLFCLFAVSVSAEAFGTEVTDTFYVVASQDSEAALDLKAQGKDVIVLSEVYGDTRQTSGSDWIDSFAEGSHIELIFAESIVENVGEYTGILLSKPITLTVRYNGFVHLITNGSASRENMFVLRHSDASINLMGSSEIFDENGDVITDFTYNASDLSVNKLQIRHPKVYCWVHDGNAYVENIRSYTGQELVYTDSGSADSVNTYEFVNCALSSGADPVGLLGQASAPKTVKISGGYYSSINIHTVRTGSFIENCTVGKFTMDNWGHSSQMLVFDNVTINNGITTYSGRTHLSFYDCTFDISKMSLGSDGGGNCYALVYTSADCENDGSLNVYRKGSGTTPVNDDSAYAQTVTDFYADPNNSALGHISEWSYNYEGDKYVSALKAVFGCSRCGSFTEEISVDALFVTLGYSVPTFIDETCITVGYAINKDAIASYESLMGSSISFGCVVAVKDLLGQNNSPLDVNGDPVTLAQGQVIKADVTDACFDQMSLKVILPEAHTSTDLLMSAYVIEANEDSVEVSYIQDNSSLVSDNCFEYVSYDNF